MSLQSDIDLAKDLISSNKIFTYKDFKKIYSFTNENIKGCFSNFDFNNSSCLSVLASSDQALEMFLGGAHKIDTFDINPLTKYYFYLKKAFLISNLGYEEFADYFSIYCKNIKSFSKDIFDSIKRFLPDDAYKFWNTLYALGNSELLYSNLLLDEFMSTRNITYLNPASFYKLKNIMINKDISFNECDIKGLPNLLKSKYDYIYLSNIMQYIDDMYKDYSIDTTTNQRYKLEQFKELILSLSRFIKDDGTILVSYIFDYDGLAFRQNPLFNTNVRNQVFKESTFSYIQFPSIFNDGKHDATLVYKKKH